MEKSDILWILAGLGLPVAAYLYVNKDRSDDSSSPIAPSTTASASSKQTVLPAIQSLAVSGNSATYRSLDLQGFVRALQTKKSVYPLIKLDDWWGTDSEQALYAIAVRYGIQGVNSMGYNSLRGFASTYSKEEQFMTLERKYEIKDRVVVQPASLIAMLIKAASNGAISSATTVVTPSSTQMVFQSYLMVDPPLAMYSEKTVKGKVQQAVGSVAADLQRRFGAGAPQISGTPHVSVKIQNGVYHIIVEYQMTVPAGIGEADLTKTDVGAYLKEYLKNNDDDIRNYMSGFSVKRINNFTV